MTAYKEILRLSSLGISNKKIAVVCGCSRTTVLNILSKSREQSLCWDDVSSWSDQELGRRLFPSAVVNPGYKMPDYEYVHREMGKNGVTLTLLWLEYCDQCRQAGDIPYKSTQFNKYYSDYVVKNKATMHINRKPGELMEVDWAGTSTRKPVGLFRHIFSWRPCPTAVMPMWKRFLTRSGKLDQRSQQRLLFFRRGYPHPGAGQPENRSCESRT